MAGSVYWIGNDGNVYLKDETGVHNVGPALASTANSYTTGTPTSSFTLPATRIDNPSNAPATTGDSGSSLGTGADPTAAERDALKAEIGGKAGTIDTVYGQLFGDLESLLKSRDSALTDQYGTQRTTAGKAYTEAIPQIDQSYASLGSYDSTQRGDARGKAKTGFEDTLTTIGNNEKSDRAKLGAYGNETKAKLTADQTSAHQNVDRVNSTNDVSALRGFRSDLENNLSTAGVTDATLKTDGQASQDLASLTGDNGRGDAAINSLDAIIKSSLPNDVKAAAVTAVTNSSGLSDADKKKVQETYGNVYAEQAAA